MKRFIFLPQNTNDFLKYFIKREGQLSGSNLHMAKLDNLLKG